MPVDPGFAGLVTRVGSFHITQRAMKRAQAEVEAAIERDALDDATRSAYLNEVRRYFEGFDREAREHLRDVDRRLERANQVHFNLSAERGVAVKRIEATSSILEVLARVEGPRS